MRLSQYAMAAVLVLVGCKVELQGAPCDSDENCPSGQRCSQGRCESIPGGAHDGGASDAGGHDGGSGDGGSDGGVNVAKICSDVITFLCARSKASGCLSTAAEADCPAILTQDMQCDQLPGLVQRGFMKFDAVAFDACLRAEQTRVACEKLEDPSCDQVVRFVAQPLGGGCPGQGSCVSGAECQMSAASACLGTCVAEGQIGSPCSNQSPCNPDRAFCANIDPTTQQGRCAGFLATGTDCSTAAWDACGPKAYCKWLGTQATCQLKPSLGQPCPDYQCVAPASCEPTTRICVNEAVVQDGAKCSQGGWPLRCGPDSYCKGVGANVQGICTSRVQANGQCNPSDRDPCVETCFCNPNGICQRRYDVTSTGCTADNQCLFGLWCSSMNGGTGVCTRYPQMNQSCQGSVGTATMNHCLGSYCDTASVCSARKASGSTCVNGQECQSGRCDYSNPAAPPGTGVCTAVCVY